MARLKKRLEGAGALLPAILKDEVRLSVADSRSRGPGSSCGYSISLTWSRCFS